MELDGFKKSSRWSSAAADFETTSPELSRFWCGGMCETSQIDPQKVAEEQGESLYFKEIYRLVKKFMWEDS